MVCTSFCKVPAQEVMSLNGPTNQRGGQAKIHSCTIRHDSLFKAVWDWLILILVFYTAIEIPYSVTFTPPKRDTNASKHTSSLWFIDEITPLTICNLWVDIMFIVDIFINFRSTFIDPNNDEIVSQPKKIALRYLTTWFIVDFFAAIPFELIVTEKIAETPASLVGLLKTARLLRLVRVARKLDRYSEYGLAVVILLTCSFMLSAHWLACIWHFIGDSELDLENGWIIKLADEYGRNSSSPNMGLTVGDRYVTALYFCLTSITTVGFGNIAPNTNNEKIFSVCVMIAGALMYAAVFGNMTAIIQRLYSRTSRFHRDLRLVEEFSKFHKIPTALREDLEEYFRHEWTYTKGVDLENVLNRFPECLRADICHHLHKKLFDECSAFASAEEGCLRALSIRFSMRHFLPGHYLIKQGDEVTSLFFIVKGSIQVVKDGVTISTLGRGDTISCDYGTLSHTYLPKANASLLIQSHTEIHHIPWKDLLVVLKAYPKFRDNFLNEIELAYNLGDPNEDDEISLTDNPSVPRVKRLSNARSTLQPCSPKNSSEEAQLNNGRLQGHSTVRCYSSEIVLNHDTHVPTVILDRPLRTKTQTQNDQIKRMENKLNNIEERLMNMEKGFNDTLGQLMEVLKNRQEFLNETERETSIGTRTTSV